MRLLTLALLLVLASTACASDASPTATGDSVSDISTLDTADTTMPASTGDATTALPPTSTDRAAPDPNAPTDALAASFADAGFDILRTQDSTTNSVLSPTSIGHALLMARAAADDATRAAIDASLNLPEGMSAHDAWNTIDAAIQDASGAARDIEGEPTPVITIADRIWPAEGVTPDQGWVDLLATHHGSDVATIDVTQADAARDEINAWVADATEGLIPDLLPPGFIDESTTLVLTDAIYFKAQWQTVFGKYGTMDGDFTLLDGSTTPTTYLRELEGRGARGAGDGWTAAELPYLGDQFSMLVVVPDAGRYDEMRTELSADLLNTIDAAITPGPYELLLPKWTDDSSIDLLPWLTEVGAAPGAYPGISPGSFLSGGVHAADIAVNEMGTVAAAATALGFTLSGTPPPELTVAADRPFFYVIRHVDSGLVLFAGQVTNPVE